MCIVVLVLRHVFFVCVVFILREFWLLLGDVIV